MEAIIMTIAFACMGIFVIIMGDYSELKETIQADLESTNKRAMERRGTSNEKKEDDGKNG